MGSLLACKELFKAVLSMAERCVHPYTMGVKSSVSYFIEQSREA